MTFVKVQDPTNKNLVKEYIVKRNRVREADRNDKMGRAFEFEELSRFFKPVTAQTQELTKQVGELPGKIARAIPRQKPQSNETLPPTYEETFPFAEEPIVPGEMKETLDNLPNEIECYGDSYKIGEISISFNPENESVSVGGKEFTYSPKIYDLLTNKNSKLGWNDLNEDEKEKYGKLIANSNILYSDYENNKNKMVGGYKKWGRLFSHIWHNRFLYMSNERLNNENEIRHMTSAIQNPNNKMEEETKNLIRSHLKLEKIGFDKRTYKTPKRPVTEMVGSGAKTNYVTLPSDPNELVERLELLLASKDAGNTGVHNEIVSICKELRKRKMLTRAEYKELLSNI